MAEIPNTDGLQEHPDKLNNRRVNYVVERFPALPDDAKIDIKVVSQLMGRSPSSLWRDVAAGRLPAPDRLGPRCVRWRVGDIRNTLKAGRHDH